MIFYYCEGGALVTDQPLPGITDDLSTHSSWNSSWHDGHRYFIAESMHRETARRIAHALGGVLLEGLPANRLLTGATVDISREVTRHALYGEHPRKKVA